MPLSVCVSVCLFACVSVCLSVSLSVCLSVSLSVCHSVRLSVSLSIYMPVSVCLSVFLSVCLSVCLSVYLSLWLFVRLSPCQPFLLWGTTVSRSKQGQIHSFPSGVEMGTWAVANTLLQLSQGRWCKKPDISTKTAWCNTQTNGSIYCDRELWITMVHGSRWLQFFFSCVTWDFVWLLEFTQPD